MAQLSEAAKLRLCSTSAVFETFSDADAGASGYFKGSYRRVQGGWGGQGALGGAGGCVEPLGGLVGVWRWLFWHWVSRALGTLARSRASRPSRPSTRQVAADTNALSGSAYTGAATFSFIQVGMGGVF
jgi:hypothetical protein